MIVTNAFPEKRNELSQYYYHKTHFKTFNFKRLLHFINIFNASVDFAAVWPTSKFVAECLTVLILYHPRLSFDFMPLFWMWTRAEKTLSQRCVAANGSNIQKASSDSCKNDSRTAHQNRESGISWKISRVNESFRRSQNWSCDSSRILAVSRLISRE